MGGERTCQLRPFATHGRRTRPVLMSMTGWGIRRQPQRSATATSRRVTAPPISIRLTRTTVNINSNVYRQGPWTRREQNQCVSQTRESSWATPKQLLKRFYIARVTPAAVFSSHPESKIRRTLHCATGGQTPKRIEGHPRLDLLPRCSFLTCHHRSGKKTQEAQQPSTFQHHATAFPAEALKG